MFLAAIDHDGFITYLFRGSKMVLYLALFTHYIISSLIGGILL